MNELIIYFQRKLKLIETAKEFNQNTNEDASSYFSTMMKFVVQHAREKPVNLWSECKPLLESNSRGMIFTIPQTIEDVVKQLLLQSEQVVCRLSVQHEHDAMHQVESFVEWLKENFECLQEMEQSDDLDSDGNYSNGI